jgi:hypothetical protein
MNPHNPIVMFMSLGVGKRYQGTAEATVWYSKLESYISGLSPKHIQYNVQLSLKMLDAVLVVTQPLAESPMSDRS